MARNVPLKKTFCGTNNYLLFIMKMFLKSTNSLHYIKYFIETYTNKNTAPDTYLHTGCLYMAV